MKYPDTATVKMTYGEFARLSLHVGFEILFCVNNIEVYKNHRVIIADLIEVDDVAQYSYIID